MTTTITTGMRVTGGEGADRDRGVVIDAPLPAWASAHEHVMVAWDSGVTTATPRARLIPLGG